MQQADQNKFELEKALKGFTKQELIDRLLELAPDMQSFYDQKNSWTRLPFIPEDCGFEAKEIKTKGSPTSTVYYRDGISCVKTIEGPWIICKGDQEKINVLLPTKFAAFHFFKSIGIEFDYSKTTIPDTILLSVDEFLESVTKK